MVNTHYLDAVPKIIRAVSMMEFTAPAARERRGMLPYRG